MGDGLAGYTVPSKGEGSVWVSRIDSVILREGLRAYVGNWRKRQIGLFGSKSAHSRDCCDDALERL